jgi:ABC-2 type transport system ATP-binding protein
MKCGPADCAESVRPWSSGIRENPDVHAGVATHPCINGSYRRLARIASCGIGFRPRLAPLAVCLFPIKGAVVSSSVITATTAPPVRVVGDGEAVITVDHLTKRFGSVTAVDDLSFTLERGTITGFLGPNGAGKTTTLRMLLGLTRPTRGTASLFGRRYIDIPDPATRVGAVLEATDFHPGRSGHDHLLMLAYAAGLSAQRVDEVLEKVSLTNAARRRVGGYSMGMRQRLGLAAALLGDPELLILDEPANGLDPEGVHWLREFLHDFASEGRTVLVSSHVLAEVAQTVHDIVIINRGRLVMVSPLADLLSRSVTGAHVIAPEAGRLHGILRSHEIDSRLLDSNELVASGVTAAEVGEIAGSAGVFLHELSAQSSSLEDIFLELTAKGE